MAAQLASLNFILAVFNLLPGFPLDGGRLLRAAIWKRTGDLQRATRLAASGGRLLGFGLIALGLLQLFAGNPVGGLWLVLIGWFLRGAADASVTQMVMQSTLAGVRIADVMAEDPITVRPELTLQEFVDGHVLAGRHRSYPVADDGRALGLVTVRQLQDISRDEWPTRTVGEVMIRAEDGITVSADTPLTEAIPNLAEATGGRLLVTRDGQLEGIITRSDLARWMERVELLSRAGVGESRRLPVERSRTVASG